MKYSKNYDPGTYEDLSSNLGQEAQQLKNKCQPSFSFDNVWDLHINDQVGVNRNKRFYSPVTKWSLTIGAVVLIVTGSLIGTGFISPQVADALRNIPFFDYLYSSGGFPDGLKQIENKNLSTLADTSVTDGDIEFRVVDVYYDGIQVVLNYEVNYPKSSPNISEREASAYYDIRFDNIQPDIISSHIFTITGTHSFAGTTIMSFGDSDDLPDKVQLNMAVERIGTTPGKWDVSLPLSKEKSEAITQTFYPKVELIFKDSKVTVEKLVFGPVSTQLVLNGDFEIPNNISVLIEDDMGTILEGQGGGGGSKNRTHSNFSPLTEINPKPKYVTLIMKNKIAGQDMKQFEERIPLNNKYPLVLQGAEGGTVTVTSIEFQENDTVVYYEVSQPMSQLTNIYLENTEGEAIFAKEQRVRNSKASYSFRLVFPKMHESDVANIVTSTYTYSNKNNQEIRSIRIPLEWE